MQPSWYCHRAGASGCCASQAFSRAERGVSRTRESRIRLRKLHLPRGWAWRAKDLGLLGWSVGYVRPFVSYANPRFSQVSPRCKKKRPASCRHQGCIYLYLLLSFLAAAGMQSQHFRVGSKITHEKGLSAEPPGLSRRKSGKLVLKLTTSRVPVGEIHCLLLC